MEEFGYDALQVLTDPMTYLKGSYIKMPTTVKPDGLTTLVNGADYSDHVIAAFQAMNWNRILDFRDLSKSLRSIEPCKFFQTGTNQRQEWLQQKDDNLWKTRFIRVC
jgi:hypothetical protein